MDKTPKFKGKFRNESARCNVWNYDSTGAYFVTICVKNRVQIFGEVINRKIILNEVGQIADRFWREIPDHFSFIKLDDFVVMSDHVHGILWIKSKHNENNIMQKNLLDYRKDVAMQRPYNTPGGNVPTTPVTNISAEKIVSRNEKMSSISPKQRSLSTVIRSYKSECTKFINQLPTVYKFRWQPRFHDRIIRNQKELEIIRQYIRQNPENWDPDKNDDLWKNLIPDYRYG